MLSEAIKRFYSAFGELIQAISSEIERVLSSVLNLLTGCLMIFTALIEGEE